MRHGRLHVRRSNALRDKKGGAAFGRAPDAEISNALGIFIALSFFFVLTGLMLTFFPSMFSWVVHPGYTYKTQKWRGLFSSRFHVNHQHRVALDFQSVLQLTRFRVDGRTEIFHKPVRREIRHLAQRTGFRKQVRRAGNGFQLARRPDMLLGPAIQLYYVSVVASDDQ